MFTTHLHEYHFIMTRGMKEKLKSLDLYRKEKSLSCVVVKILSLLAPIIKKEHKWGEQRMSRYLPVSEDPDEIREHMHVYFPGEIYRQLKLMHQDLNVYSIAQLIRGFLELFLDMVISYGDNVFQKLKKIFKRWKEEDGNYRLTPRQIVRQLYKIIEHFSGNSRLINIYDQFFSPSWILLL